MHILSRELYLQQTIKVWHKPQHGLSVDQDENHSKAMKYDLTFQTMIPYNSTVTLPYATHD